jgi:hypothetical protein
VDAGALAPALCRRARACRRRRSTRPLTFRSKPQLTAPPSRNPPPPPSQLHAVAAYFPDAPADADAAAARALVAALARLYPCAHCRADFAADVAAHPVDARSRAAFAAWACAAHNRVNAKLGKRAADCSDAALNARWRAPRAECGAAAAAAIE